MFFLSPPATKSRSPCSGRAAVVTPSPSLSDVSYSSRSPSSPSSTLLRRRLNISSPPLLQVSASSDKDGYTELHPQSYVERLQAKEGSPSLEDGSVYFSPVVETVSCFKPGRYHSPLMPKENKPLEVGILRRVKELLAEVDPRTAAKHVTKTDCLVKLNTYIFLQSVLVHS